MASSIRADPRSMDLNGDGSAELVGKDDSFDYAFASYAESYAPPKIFRLVGRPDQGRICRLRIPAARPANAAGQRGAGVCRRVERQRVSCGLGRAQGAGREGADAWRRMLDLYDRNSDWDLSVCMSPRQARPVSGGAKRLSDFPTALREHLAREGYSLAGIVAAPVAAANPSFDCNKARTPSEIEICQFPPACGVGQHPRL